MSVGCGSDGSPSTPTPTPEESTSDQVSEPVVDDLFTIGTSGLRAAMQCFGEGSPAIVLEAGTDSAGIERFATLIRSLAERNMTCTYDRLGTGLSDPRSSSDLDDLVAVLHELLDAAAVPGPYLLVGSSGGGLIVVHYAGRYPEEVAGLVLLDVASPAPDLAKEFPDEAGWDNVEHID